MALSLHHSSDFFEAFALCLRNIEKGKDSASKRTNSEEVHCASESEFVSQRTEDVEDDEIENP